MSALLAVGCGGGDSKKKDNAAYVVGATTATTATSKLGDDLGTTINTADQGSDADLAVKLRGLAERAHAIVDDLRALKPPDKSKAKVDALAKALETGAKDLDTLTSAVQASNADASKTGTQVLLADSPAIKTANAALKAEVHNTQ